MSKPSEKPQNKKPVTRMPDVKAIRKLFPKEVIEHAKQAAKGHEKRSTPKE